MSVARAALNVALGTAAKLLGALATIKIMAFFLGPAGVGMLGNFMSVVAILNILTCAGVSVGVTRFVARYSGAPKSLRRVLRSSSALVGLLCTLLILVFVFFAPELSKLIFYSSEYENTLRFGAILFIPLGFSIFFMAVLNGLSETGKIAWVQSGAAILGGGGLYLMTKEWGVGGAAIGLLWIGACSSLLLIPAVFKNSRIKISDFKPTFDTAISRLMFRYALMMLVTVVCQNFAQFQIRALLLEAHGWSEVGYWQAMSRTSDAYLQLFNAFLMAYLLPLLSRERNPEKALKIISSTYRFVIPSLLGVLLVGYLIRDLLIQTIFADTFKPVRDLFLPQMIADFLKIMAFIPGYLVIARGYTPFLIAADPFQVILLLAISPYLIEHFGALGACFAAALTYFIYLLIVTALMLRYRKSVISSAIY